MLKRSAGMNGLEFRIRARMINQKLNLLAFSHDTVEHEIHACPKYSEFVSFAS